MVQQQITLPKTIEVPVRTYTNPDTGAQVTYFGMLHVAQEPFFAEVRDRVTRLEADGAHVYLEGITSPASDTLGADTDELRWGVGVVKRKLETMWREGEALGLVAQRDALPARDGWQVHDVTVLEAVQIYGVEALRNQHQDTQREGLLLDHFDPALTRAMTMQSLALVMKAATDTAIRDILFPEHEATLARVREGKVVAALDRQLAAEPDAHIVVVWGAGHLVSYDEALTERGYKSDDEQWLTAIDVATLPPLIPQQRA
ncbi:hypothetical protein KGA66_17975 [Actinocrinis puniceicyclus]|uniref:TraB/GumN family protein n=1 Tax=Actinocrinis puniceicyclus TaxID=977794 RepID=A0A8J7WSP4_9ACTN|nr:hypothetical protein [Actinocrinis puniceicyclus]MBS2964950.1 hypothetical protein [Actinocrinis puniceicyclus]